MANFFPDQRTSAHIFRSKRRLHQGNQNFEVTLGIDSFFWVAKNLVKQNNQNQTKRKLLKSTILPTSGKLETANEMYVSWMQHPYSEKSGGEPTGFWVIFLYPNKTHPPATKRPCDIDRSKEVVSITDKTERTPMRLRPTEDTWVLGHFPVAARCLWSK